VATQSSSGWNIIRAAYIDYSWNSMRFCLQALSILSIVADIEKEILSDPRVIAILFFSLFLI
jgi:hypothetical protein